MRPQKLLRTRGQIARDLLLALYPLVLPPLTLATLALEPRQGLLALAQVFAHFLFLPALLLAPLALMAGTVLLRLALALVAATFLIVYPPAWALPGPPAAAPELTVLQWNVFVGEVSPAELERALVRHRPDVVTLQEADLELLAADDFLRVAYPYRLLGPDETAPSLAVLSRYPIVESGVPELDPAAFDMPRVVWARVELGDQTVTVVNAHPIPPVTFGEGCNVLRCYNAGPRDAQIVAVRRFVEGLRQRTGDPLILAGDMNVTEREPAYFDLAAGLRDAHRAAGSGFGTSWRPDALGLPFGLLRIDYILADERARPLGLETDCRRRASDHCMLVGSFSID